MCVLIRQPANLDVHADTSVPVDGTSDRATPTLPTDRNQRASQWSPQLGRGQLIDEKFRLRRLLGRGGMALVMLAQDVSLDREVAIKFLGTNLVSDPSWRARFVVEARNMARVRHENVAQIFSYGIHEGWPFFVMEFVDGTTLADWIRRHPSPAVVDVANLVRAIAAGLSAIHDAGLVHHDVKPANVLIDAHGRVVVTDLGLSRVVTGFRAFGNAAGTPRYMAPEQVSQRPVLPSLAARTDVYQLGITTFELLVGQVPFDAKTPQQLFDCHRHSPVPRPSSLRRDLSKAIDRVLLRALEKEPENRYASPLDFAQALDRAIAPAARLANKPSRGLRVLVAEDDDDQRMLTCAVLSVGLCPGSRIEQARNGKETLSAAEQHRFDVFVLDLQMPDMTGIQLASALRTTHGQSAHIVVVSGNGGAEDWRSLHDLGVDAMLLKPFAAQQLISAIESATR